jgi:hypothetical protein
MLLLQDGGYLNYGTNEKDTINFKLKETDLVLIKTDSCGIVQWINDTGYLADGDPDMWAIEMDSGNIMVVGYTDAPGRIRVGKYNKDGQLVKEKLIQGSPASAPYGVVKNKTRHNSYFINGYTYNVALGKTKPLLVEIDGNLDIINWKEIYHPTFSQTMYNGGLFRFTQISDTTYSAVVSAGTSTVGLHFICKLDTQFTVKEANSLNNDTIFKLLPFSMFFNNNMQVFDCAGVYQRAQGSRGKDCLFKMDLEGRIQQMTFFDDSIYNIRCMNPTKDGGFIMSVGLQYLKLDSSFKIEWTRPTRGVVLSIEELDNGGYVGGGMSELHTISLGFKPGYDEMYLVKMDKDGDFIHTGIIESSRSLTSPVNIYPNPANSTITINSPMEYSTAELRSLAGSILRRDVNLKTIDISDIQDGLYILNLLGTQNEILATQKVSVIH